ncbi:DUF4142 domain-containing protein [Persicimonas caeni]|uniref:DUF4142 domain-containing protein n=1 Tax=Persicimonas caeni TaxID=2292766 RepID=A0A4Y6Q3G6_PERCE|nr:DUF4142 domain-containing protein [Persicimonas caeni]QDG54545.1 DUF4142 domain-containing protein [Persicimonas caeni]QED35766.1 DUF4142 domain-containing protein [Persicimonas caeni]
MKKRRIVQLLALVLTVAMGTFGCATGGEETETTMEPSEPTAQQMQAMDSGQILYVLQTVNDAEISQARMAMRRSQNPEIQTTAEMIIADHQALNQRIQDVAEQTDAQMSESQLSRDISNKVSQVEQRLEGLSGEEFDREFMRSQVELHDIALSTAQNELMPAAQDAQVQQVLSDASTRFEQHLTLARQGYQQMQDEAIGGGPEEDQEKMDRDEIEQDEIDEDEMDKEKMDDDQWQ